MIWEATLVTLLVCGVGIYIFMRADLGAYLEQLRRELKDD